MSATTAVTRPIESGRGSSLLVRRMGSRPARDHGRALSRRPLSQSRILRLDVRAVLGAARRVALRRHGGRHDVRSGQQGARSFRRLDLRPDGDVLWHAVRAELFRPRRHDRRLRLSCARPRHRLDQRLSRHGSRGAGVHRDPDHAVHRPRRHPRADRRQEHRVRTQGGQILRRSSASARSTRSASTTRSSSSSSSRRSAPSLSPIRPTAGRPMRPAETSRPPATPASTPALFACAPTCCLRSAPSPPD